MHVSVAAFTCAWREVRGVLVWEEYLCVCFCPICPVDVQMLVGWACALPYAVQAAEVSVHAPVHLAEG